MRLRKSNYAYNIQMLWKQSIDQVLADNTVRYWGYFYYYGLLAEKDTTNALSYTLCDQSIV